MCPLIPTSPAPYLWQHGQERKDECRGGLVPGRRVSAQCHRDVNTKAGHWVACPLVTAHTIYALLISKLTRARPMPVHASTQMSLPLDFSELAQSRHQVSLHHWDHSETVYKWVQLSWFLFLVIMNKAALHVLVHMFLWILVYTQEKWKREIWTCGVTG